MLARPFSSCPFEVTNLNPVIAGGKLFGAIIIDLFWSPPSSPSIAWSFNSGKKIRSLYPTFG